MEQVYFSEVDNKLYILTGYSIHSIFVTTGNKTREMTLEQLNKYGVKKRLTFITLL